VEPVLLLVATTHRLETCPDGWVEEEVADRASCVVPQFPEQRGKSKLHLKQIKILIVGATGVG